MCRRFSPASAGKVLLFLLLLLPIVAAQGQSKSSSEDIRSLKSHFKDLSDLRKQLEKLDDEAYKAALELDDLDPMDSRRMELQRKLLTLRLRRSQLQGRIKRVVSGIRSTLGSIADGGSKKAINTVLTTIFAAKKPAELEVEEAAISALAKTKNEATVKHLIQSLTRGANRKTVIILCEVMKRRKEKQAVDALLKLLKTGREEVKIAAADALARIRARKAIEPMIEALERHQKPGKKESLARALTIALQNMTGKYDFFHASEFRAWWEREGKESYDENKPPPTRSAAKIGKDDELRTVLYGTITSKRVIFVCDISGSMSAWGRIPTGSGKEKSRKKRSPLDGLSKLGQPPPPEKLPDNFGTAGVKPGYSGMRITMLKIELAYVINRILSDDAKFNIITYSGEVNKWKKSLTPVTPKNTKEALEFIKSMKAKGGTNTYGALEEAFKDKDVDTIYFLSDGSPSVGERTEHNEILAAVRRWGRGRSVVLYTIGLLVGRMDLLEDKPKLANFLTRLAEENDGTVKILSDN